MQDISKIDSNFKVQTNLGIDDVKFYDVKKEPFHIYGVFYESGKFRRMPEKIAESVSPGVYALHAQTAGGRVRFMTDSPYIAIHAKMPQIGKMPHFALTGSAGFDLYVGESYYKTFVPPFDIRDGYESVIRFEDSAARDITVNFPLYSEVSELYIGICETADIRKGTNYKIKKPIVYYGSSITQGGCASRPGNSYESIISRKLNCDYINLGFSGSARGEDEIADYIKALDMSVFVYDYDHNAPSAEHLKSTHQKMFQTIRKANPDLPIVIMSRPEFHLSPEEERRLEIIEKTYRDAVQSGDKNVCLITGPQLMGIAENNGTVDGCHPNDLGFASMAKVTADALRTIMKADFRTNGGK